MSLNPPQGYRASESSVEAELAAGVPSVNTEQVNNIVYVDPGDDYQAAADAAAGGVLYFNKGIHELPVQDGGISLKGLDNFGIELDSDTYVTGDPDAVIDISVSLPSGEGGYWTAFTNKNRSSAGDTNIRIEGLKFLLPAPVETATGMDTWVAAVDFTGASESVVEDCYVENGSIAFRPVAGDINTANVLANESSSDNVVVDCIIEPEAGSSAFDESVRCKWIRNEVIGAWDNGIQISGGARGHRIIDSYWDMTPPTSGKGANSGGISMNNDGSVLDSETVFEDIVIKNCEVANNNNYNSGSQVGIRLFPPARDIKIIDCNIHDNIGGQGGLFFNRDSPLENIKVIGTTFRANSERGIKATTGSDVISWKNIVIRDCDFVDNNDRGIATSNGAGASIKGIKILNCKFYEENTTNQTYWVTFVTGDATAGDELRMILEGNEFLNGTMDFLGTDETLLSRENSGYITSRVPSTPRKGDEYVDDGTNTGSGNLAKRIYDGAAWVDQN